jgi:hypothetical protein
VIRPLLAVLLLDLLTAIVLAARLIRYLDR